MPSDIDSRLQTFGELLRGGRRYFVPIYQRDYSWTETEVEQLWKDIIETIDEGRIEHFMGAIVVNNADGSYYQLIDGQQRIATISLLMCAIRDIFISRDDIDRSGVISGDYLGETDLATLELRPKLVLNENNNPFYTENIARVPADAEERIRLLAALERRRDVRKSNKLLLRAYLSLRRKVAARLGDDATYLQELVAMELPRLGGQ